ncbi:Golga6l1p [Xylographa soralifera]|nr:Golga6l1p [Xylographa soralifera]
MVNDGDRFRDRLENYGVTFDEHVYDEHKLRLPSHVEAVRKQLLDFKRILPWHAVKDARRREQVNHELLKCLPEEQTDEIYFTGTRDANARSTLGHRPYLVKDEAGKNRISEDHGIQDHEINFMHAVVIAEDARRLNSQDGIDEATFGRRLDTHLFRRWFECGDKNENYDPLDSIVSRQDNTILYYASAARYEVLRHSAVSIDENSLHPKRSKPDRFFAFPIHADSDDSKSTPSRSYEQFSLTKLAELQKFGLCSCPVMNLDKFLSEAPNGKRQSTDKGRESTNGIPSPGKDGTETAIYGESNDRENDERKSSNSRLLCYPWVIVELKPPVSAKSEILKCYCQAANGVSSSLTLLEQLTKHRGEAHAQEPIPPILSLSFIGSEVKVWLAYTKISEVDDSWKKPCWKFVHHSTCIWDGSLKNTLDAVRLCRILDNALFWALRRLRPWIAHHLDAFYDRAQVDQPGLRSGDSIGDERQADTKRMIDKRLELQQWEQKLIERQQAMEDQEQDTKKRELAMKIQKQNMKKRDQAIEDREQAMGDQKQDIKERDQAMEDREQAVEDREQAMEDQEQAIQDREQAMKNQKQNIKKREQAMENLEQVMKNREQALKDLDQGIEVRKQAVEDRELSMKDLEEKTKRRSKQADSSERELNERKGKVEGREKRAEELEKQLTEREKALKTAKFRTKKKESEIQKHEDALVEREARYKERMTECVEAEIELQRREKGLKEKETETEALITRIYFDVQKLQGKRAEARDLDSEIPHVSGGSSKGNAQSPSGFIWPRKEPRQNKDGASDHKVFHSGAASRSDESKGRTQGLGAQTSAKDPGHQRNQSKAKGSGSFGTQYSIRTVNAASGFTTPQSSSNTPFRTTSAGFGSQPFSFSTSFLGKTRSGPGAFDSSSNSSLLKAKSTSDLFGSHSSGEVQSTSPRHDPSTSYSTDTTQPVHSQNFSKEPPSDKI